MKKLIILFLLLSLTSCWVSKNEEINENDAKQLLLEEQKKGSDSFKEEIKTEDNSLEKPSKPLENNNSENKDENLEPSLNEITFPAGQAILLDDLPKITNKTTYVWIQGYVDSEVDKIEVKFSNLTSDFENDSFVLKKFKKWNNRFLYNANKVYEVLDFGLNEYEIIAYKWEEKFITRLEIVVPREWDIKSDLPKSDNKNIIIDDSILENKQESENSDNDFSYNSKTFENPSLEESFVLQFPENSYIWEVLNLSNNEFTYSKIENLTLSKLYKSKDINCSDLTAYVLNNYDFAYWNTCRAIWDFDSPKWHSFFVLYTKNDKFHYEKHYYDKENLVYWIVDIISWTGVDKDNISQKNKDFKEEYNSIDNLKKADILFENIK